MSMTTYTNAELQGAMRSFLNEIDTGTDVAEDFYPDDALPTHHLDEDYGGRQRGVCPHSGTGNMADGCPRGCEGASEHYSNDGHRACVD